MFTPESRAAGILLHGLADVAAGRPSRATEFRRILDDHEAAAWADWLVARDLAAPGFALAAPVNPRLADRLRGAALGAAAANLIHSRTVALVEERFARASVAMVLLKGVSVAAAYADPALRPMTDVDIWVRPEEMETARAIVEDLGFRQDPGLATRPPSLQRHCSGEVVFRPLDGTRGMLELHFGAFQGWWAKRTANPSDEGLWRRAEAVAPGRHARRLAVEDAVLQTAFHLAVSQFGQAPLRGMLDLAVLARRIGVRWEVVADRARRRRLHHLVWLVLDGADRLFGLPGVAESLAALRPSLTRIALLRLWVTTGGLLRGRDLRSPLPRNALLCALVDRPRDLARLLGRSIWPETWWLEARYGPEAGRLEHLLALARRGGV